jgi:hypothetical protein
MASSILPAMEMSTPNSSLVLITSFDTLTAEPGDYETDFYGHSHACFWIYFCTTLMIAPLGIIGNIFSIVVFLSAANFRRSSTVQFLIGLAVTDSLYLVGELFNSVSNEAPWGEYLTPIHFVNTTNFGCKSIMWLRYRFKSRYLNLGR